MQLIAQVQPISRRRIAATGQARRHRADGVRKSIDPKDKIRNAAVRFDWLAQQNRNSLAAGIGIQSHVLRIIAISVYAASHPWM